MNINRLKILKNIQKFFFFITGADGFVGFHLVEKIIKLDHNLKVFIFYNFRSTNSHLDNLEEKLFKNLNIVSGDIRDHHFMEKQIRGYDVVHHLAALMATSLYFY
jgi:nucleoside-diphosphate-sugar epimerase